MPSDEEIRSRFRFYPADTQEKQALHASVRLRCGDLAEILNRQLPEGREKALAFTNLEQVMFWANAAVARSDSDA